MALIRAILIYKCVLSFEEKIVGGEFNIDMNSIKCTDIENPAYAAKLEEHLKDPDFFNSSKYQPQILKLQISSLMELHT